MPDNLTPEQRRRCMSRVRNRDTAPERLLRSAVHRQGLRFRKHVRQLPGTPDLVFPRAQVAVFVDGDFWHGFRYRDWCERLAPFWQAKIGTNRARDLTSFTALRAMGWRVLRIWDHEIEADLPLCCERVTRAVARGPRRAKCASS